MDVAEAKIWGKFPKKDSPDNEKEAMAHWGSLPPFAVSVKKGIKKRGI